MNNTKKTLAITSVLALSFGLSACGGGESAENAPEPAQTVTVTAEASPSQSQSPTNEPSESETETESATPTPTPTESADEDGRDYGDGSTNARGNMIKEVGQWSGIGSPEDPLLNFRITKMEVDPTCTEYGNEGPDNGHFLALHLEAESFDGLEQANYDSEFSFSTFDSWTAYNSDGSRSNVDPITFSASFCLDDKTMLGDIGDSEKVKGVVVLDVEDSSGSIALNSDLAGGAWEWEY